MHRCSLALFREEVVRAAQSTSPFDSIPHYEELQKFVASVTDVCSTAQDATGQKKLHVVTTLEDIRESTWTDIKAAFTTYALPVVARMSVLTLRPGHSSLRLRSYNGLFPLIIPWPLQLRERSLRTRSSIWRGCRLCMALLTLFQPVMLIP